MDQKEKLRKLLNSLHLGMTEEEVVAKVAKLTARQIDNLILMCEEVEEYQDALAEEAKSVDPEEFKKLEDNYAAIVAKIQADESEPDSKAAVSGENKEARKAKMFEEITQLLDEEEAKLNKMAS